MKRKLIAAVIIASAAVPAFAQTQTPSATTAPKTPAVQMQDKQDKMTQPATGTNAMTTGTTTERFIAAQTGSEWRASQLIGASVTGPDGKTIGDVNEIILDTNGSAHAAVIGVGGVLGVGEKDVAVPFTSLSITRDKDGKTIEKISLSYTQEELKSAPNFKWHEAGRQSMLDLAR